MIEIILHQNLNLVRVLLYLCTCKFSGWRNLHVKFKKRKPEFRLRCNTTVTKWPGWFFDLSPNLALLMAELILSQVECPMSMHLSVSPSIQKLWWAFKPRLFFTLKDFSLPEPSAHGELLWSLDVRPAWCVVRRVSSTIASKDISS